MSMLEDLIVLSDGSCERDEVDDVWSEMGDWLNIFAIPAMTTKKSANQFPFNKAQDVAHTDSI